MWCDEELHRLRSHENIIALFERIFKQSVLLQPNFFLRNFFPDDSPTDSHQDKIFVGGGDFCTMWVPLGDFPVEQGVLTVAAGSNHQGVRKAKFAGMGTLDDLSGSWVTNDFRAGDVLIFTNLTVHRSMPNLTNKLRQSFDARYQPAQFPIANLSLTPSKDSGCKDWDEVYADWQSDDGQFYWKNLDLKVVELERKYYEADYPEAFEKALKGDLAMRVCLLLLI
jgi:ectoine hydroxylase-related dioxygenase (phytanoyl-CoA dioxygenase family)